MEPKKEKEEPTEQPVTNPSEEPLTTEPNTVSGGELTKPEAEPNTTETPTAPDEKKEDQQEPEESNGE